MKYYVRIDGGIGRCIAATGAVAEFAKDKEVIVISSFPDVFINLPNIERVYPIGTPFIYEDHISKGVYLEPEPYNDIAYYAEEKSLAQVFNKLLNKKDEYIAPILSLTENDKINGEQMIKNIPKPVILIQPYASSGGKMSGCDQKTCKELVDNTYRSFSKDFTDKLIDELIDKGFQPFIVKGPDQVGNPKAMSFNNGTPFKAVFSIIPYVKGIISCDSFLHHASAALGTPVKTVVLWGGTSEKNVGYPEHINLRNNKKVKIAPNRIPHNPEYYIKENAGANDFGSLLDSVIKNFK